MPARPVPASCRPKCASGVRPKGQTVRDCLDACAREACRETAEKIARQACRSEPSLAFDACMAATLPEILKRFCPEPERPAPRARVRRPGMQQNAPGMQQNAPRPPPPPERVVPVVDARGRTGYYRMPEPAPAERQIPPHVSLPPAPPSPAPLPPPVPADRLCGTPEQRRRTEVVTPQATEAARYALMDAADLIPSHNPETFAADPRYPREVQERLYNFKQSEQLKVNEGAKNLRPGILIHTAPTPADGPPLVTRDGCVLGGNGRSMMVKLAYRQGAAGPYRESLACRAGEFGFERADVDALPNPVLVRVVDGLSCGSPQKDLASAVRRFNLALTNALDEVALGVSEARLLSPSTVQLFGSMLEGDRTLRKAMEEQPALFLRALENDGIVTRQERDRWVTESGALTAAAKSRIEATYLGKVMQSAERVRSMPDGVRAKVEKLVPYLLTVEARNPQYGQSENVRRAVDLINEAAGSGKDVEKTLEQVDIGERHTGAGFGPSGERKADPVVVGFARTLVQKGVGQLRDRFRQWAQASVFDPDQTMLGMSPPTVEEARAILVGDARPDARTRSFFRNMLVQQPEGIAEIAAVFDAKEVEEGGSGVKRGHVRLRYLLGPRKGREEELPVEKVGDTVRR